jgi:hypothetical protein
MGGCSGTGVVHGTERVGKGVAGPTVAWIDEDAASTSKRLATRQPPPSAATRQKTIAVRAKQPNAAYPHGLFPFLSRTKTATTSPINSRISRTSDRTIGSIAYPQSDALATAQPDTDRNACKYDEQ